MEKIKQNSFPHHNKTPTALACLIFSLVEIQADSHFVHHVICSWFILLWLAVQLSSSPLRPSSKECTLWPREKQHLLCPQYVGHLSTVVREQEWQATRNKPKTECFRAPQSDFIVVKGREYKCLSLTCMHSQTDDLEGEQAWVDLILIRCVECLGGVMRVRVRGQKSGVTQRVSNGAQESVAHRCWPLHLCTSSHSAALLW